VMPETLVDVERGLEVTARRFAVATARMPLEWTVWDTALSGAFTLPDGSRVEWSDGVVHLASPEGRTDTLNFQGPEPILTLGASIACCRRDQLEAPTLVRFEEVRGSLVVDGRAFSSRGYRQLAESDPGTGSEVVVGPSGTRRDRSVE